MTEPQTPEQVIAGVLEDHIPLIGGSRDFPEYTGQCDCNWRGETKFMPEFHAHQAAEVVAALGLREDMPTRTVLAGFDFRGCTDRDPDHCACATHEDLTCDRCEGELHDGDEAWTLMRRMYPYLEADDRDQDWEHHAWHVECPKEVPADGD